MTQQISATLFTHGLLSVLRIKTYQKLVADSEVPNEIKEYLKAKARIGNAIPFEQEFKEIEEAAK